MYQLGVLDSGIDKRGAGSSQSVECKKIVGSFGKREKDWRAVGSEPTPCLACVMLIGVSILIEREWRGEENKES